MKNYLNKKNDIYIKSNTLQWTSILKQSLAQREVTIGDLISHSGKRSPVETFFKGNVGNSGMIFILFFVPFFIALSD